MMIKALTLSLTATLLCGTSLFAQTSTVDDGSSYYKAAQADLTQRLSVKHNEKKAKNVIIFVGDGMGTSTTTAARILAGQMRGVDGESYVLVMDGLPYTGLVKTYAHDSQVADSAPTATALLAGVKTSNGVIGLDHRVTPSLCKGAADKSVVSLIELAEAQGRATGIVTTTRITHATPAAGYAHTPERDWEDDSELTDEAKASGCVDIARQLVEWNFGDGMEVVLGGGRRYFMPNTSVDPEYAAVKGKRKDGRDLIKAWQKRYKKGSYVWDAKGFASLDPKGKEPVLGLFEPDHMQYELDRPKDGAGEPSLADMTRFAISRVQSNPNGLVLLIEGGRIDHAHHAGQAGRALADTVAFDDAVSAALSMVDPEETLIIVTADHSHGLTISGYPARNNPILDIVKDSDGKVIPAGDGKPYTTLTYATGPGAKSDGARDDLSNVHTDDPDYHQQALIPSKSAAHAGEDVAVRAVGPFAHLVQGTIEQNLIFHIILHASQIKAKNP
ncbi:alkaline phosphatase [Asticcacaulis sp.]|uniref:alkaline phosphatase n=1 Tax=Asticcacaulis sp. TaxID=1872648 RepID=UPI00391B1B31